VGRVVDLEELKEGMGCEVVDVGFGGIIEMVDRLLGSVELMIRGEYLGERYEG
jgi:hypothetical protein